jgi:TfoX/Sxy family transcriptional regulator of competence genes
MAWQKAPLELISFIDENMKGLAAERRMMFGYPAYFVNQNMFGGLFQDTLFLRLPDEQVKDLQESGMALRQLEPMPGRPMKSYFVIPPSLLKDPSAFHGILVTAFGHAKSLTPKEKKSGRKK